MHTESEKNVGLIAEIGGIFAGLEGLFSGNILELLAGIGVFLFGKHLRE